MARTLVASGGRTTSGTPTASGSFTPTASSLLLAVYAHRSGASNALTIADTLGTLTWTQYTRNVDAGGHHIRVSIFWAIAPASPSAGTVTVTSDGNVARTLLRVWQDTSIDTGSPIRQNKSGISSASTLSYTFDSAPLSTNACFAAVCSVLSTGDIAAGATWSELEETATAVGSSDIDLEIQDRISSTSTTIDWSNLNTLNNVAVAVEISAPAAASSATSLVSGKLTSSILKGRLAR
jgi:hypothetical protein